MDLETESLQMGLETENCSLSRLQALWSWWWNVLEGWACSKKEDFGGN